jgi:hypothetical protein
MSCRELPAKAGPASERALPSLQSLQHCNGEKYSKPRILPQVDLSIWITPTAQFLQTYPLKLDGIENDSPALKGSRCAALNLVCFSFSFS